MPRVLLVARIRAALLQIVIACVGATIAPLAAQSVPDRVSGPATRPAFGPSTKALREIETSDSIAVVRATALRRATSIPDDDSPGRRRLWPYFALGGAVAGGGAVLGMVFAACRAD